MSEVSMLLDDPGLTRRSPGEEFALAYARNGPKAALVIGWSRVVLGYKG